MAFKVDAEKIKRWREERHWSQEHLAGLAGIGLRTIQRVEKGEPAAKETLMALGAAFNVDAMDLSLDPEQEAAKILISKNQKIRAAMRLSLGISAASYVLGMIIFAGISLGMQAGSYVMVWPSIWWTVGLVAHGVTALIIELATRYQDQYGA
ncbi:helix-turn-helix domain-containing protein [Woodsholea maritima]|uniref:helix-turn-helix domain-containing protein n=1 Tax=Woodsholea maritima TaxID=240237 RepID=UPI00036B288B|nr:helix-turn-helix transcriptional regulator [Woodsholea maritima]